MTISSATRKAGPFLGNSVASTFPFTFKVFQASDLQVIKTSTLGIDSLLALNSDYSISLNADQNANPGGTITYPLIGALLATGEKLTATGVLGALQQTHITNGGNFFANNIEDQMDYLTILVQQITEQLSRVALASSSDLNPVLSIGTAVQRALKYISFDASGNLSLSQALPSGTLSLGSILSFLGADPILRQTAAEIAAGVTPTNLIYAEGDLRRYGGVGNGSTDDSVAWQRAVNVGLVKIPRGYSFKILTPATKTGQVTILGEGKSSKLLCDSTVLTVTGGTGSLVDNFWMENLTAPYIITRNPANWSAALTPTQSNGLGYQPTTNDPEYATWVGAQPLVGTQNIGPAITFTGVSSHIDVSRIYGRFVRINMLDTIYSTVRDCDFQGGKGTFGALLWDNCSNNLQRGVNNKSINNRIYFASQTAIVSISNDDFVYEGNTVFGCGQSGLQTAQTSGFTFTASPSGLTSQTLTAPFSGVTASDYGLFFDNGEVRQNVTLTNGSAVASWTTIIGAGAGIQVAAWGHSSLYNNSTMAPMCLRGQIVGNRVYQHYFDGLDFLATFGLTNGAVRSYHQICDNYSYQNRGDGMNIDGQFGNVSGNTLALNGLYGIWGTCQNTKIVDNHLIDNNQQRNATVAEIQATGGPGNVIKVNHIYGGTGQNCAAILTTAASLNYITDNVGTGVSVNNVGNPGSIAAVYDNNNDNTVGAATEQCFLFRLINNGGTLQHIFYADQSGAGPGKFDRIIGATSGGFTNTPAGTDASTAFGAGAKIGSAANNALWFNTAAQPPTAVRMIAVIVANSTGTALTVIPMFQAININGALVTRLTYQLVNAATGAGFSLNTTNIAAGKEIDIMFYGKLS